MKLSSSQCTCMSVDWGTDILTAPKATRKSTPIQEVCLISNSVSYCFNVICARSRNCRNFPVMFSKMSWLKMGSWCMVYFGIKLLGYVHRWMVSNTTFSLATPNKRKNHFDIDSISWNDFVVSTHTTVFYASFMCPLWAHTIKLVSISMTLRNI